MTFLSVEVYKSIEMHAFSLYSASNRLHLVIN